MKAAQYNTYGDPEVIEINADALKPKIKDGQILVKVHNAAINPFDYKVRRGYLKDTMPLTFPVTLGGDFAGVVTEVAPGVTGISTGDEVYGQALVVNGGSGSLAEFAAANIKNTAKKPAILSYAEAASLVLVGASAIQALEEHISLTKDQKILVQGGAGGIGSIAIQLAKHIGAYVITTVSPKDIDFVKSLGADEVIDYTTKDFEDNLKDLDAVFDTVGGETLTKSFSVIKRGGVLVSMAGKPDEKKAEELGITAVGQGTGTTTARLNRLRELIEVKAIKPQIDTAFPLDEAKAAFDYLENAHPKGKVVIEVNS